MKNTVQHLSCCQVPDLFNCIGVVDAACSAEVIRLSVGTPGCCRDPEATILHIYELGGTDVLLSYPSDGIDDAGQLSFLLDSEFTGLPPMRYRAELADIEDYGDPCEYVEINLIGPCHSKVQPSVGVVAGSKARKGELCS